jgi:hypothetical protein
MSNSNESTAMQSLFASVPAFGYAIAMGKDTFTDVGDRIFRAALSDVTITADIVPALYDAIHSEAVAVGLAKRKPMKDQTTKSRNSQVSKLANFPILAAFAQANDDVVTVYDWLRSTAVGSNGQPEGLGVSGYTKVVSALVAMKAALVKDGGADTATLQSAVIDALHVAPDSASEAVAKVAATWEKLVHGDEKSGPSIHADAFSALLAGYPADYARTIGDNLAAIVAIFERVERDAAAAVAIAKAR